MKLTPVTATPSKQTTEPARQSYRGRGALKDQLIVGPEFFDQLSDEECGVADETGAA